MARPFRLLFIVALLLISATAAFPRHSIYVNQIEGMVYDEKRNPDTMLTLNCITR